MDGGPRSRAHRATGRGCLPDTPLTFLRHYLHPASRGKRLQVASERTPLETVSGDGDGPRGSSAGPRLTRGRRPGRRRLARGPPASLPVRRAARCARDAEGRGTDEAVSAALKSKADPLLLQLTGATVPRTPHPGSYIRGGAGKARTEALERGSRQAASGPRGVSAPARAGERWL